MAAAACLGLCCAGLRLGFSRRGPGLLACWWLLLCQDIRCCCLVVMRGVCWRLCLCLCYFVLLSVLLLSAWQCVAYEPLHVRGFICCVGLRLGGLVLITALALVYRGLYVSWCCLRGYGWLLWCCCLVEVGDVLLLRRCVEVVVKGGGLLWWLWLK